MHEVPTSVEVDGRRFSIHASGPDGALEVDTSTGERVRLRRWRYEEHLRALDRHATAGEHGLQFDAKGFARDMLRDSGVPAPLLEELAPLALWWATGGGQEPSSGMGPDGWVRAGPIRARLRPWTFAQRSKAMSESLTSRADGSQELRLERYLRAMLSASVTALEPPGMELAMLDGATTAALLDAVMALNTSGERDEDRRLKAADADGRTLARMTLRLCKALGWTPSQVWETPAAEIDRLLALLDVAEPPAPVAMPVRRTPRLADHPDAVVIQVEDG